MPGESRIEWTDATWNPVTGCTEVSPGCDHCYARTFAERFRGVPDHPYRQGFDLRLWPERLDQPLRWTRPRRIFVNSMSDLFHEDVPDDFIQQVFAVMQAASWHEFQVLTKRAPRVVRMADHLPWPPNVWMGASVESQSQVGRVRMLARVPAAVRFVSAEPLLGPIELGNMPWSASRLPFDWLIVGGESGPGARFSDPDWMRYLRDQCRAVGVAFFVKQMGTVWAREHGVRGKGGALEDLPTGLRVREWPR
jgi:protein gp37